MQVEERKPKVQRSFRNLTSVADHTSLLEPHPLIQCRDEFQEDWKELYEQVRERKGKKGRKRERKWYMYICRHGTAGTIQNAMDANTCRWKNMVY